MSDFLLSTLPRPLGVLRGCLERYLAPVAQDVVEHHGAWGSLAVVLGPHDRAVVREDEGSLTVLVGDPVVRIAPEGAGRASTGGRREAVHSLLRGKGPVAWDEHLDGHFAALMVDRATGAGRVLTDLMGFVPVFAASPRGGGTEQLVVGTHPDAVAWAAGRNGDMDLVSAADLLVHLSVTFPRTLFSGVEQVPPGTDRAFAAGRGWTGPGHSYWEPVERDAFASLEEAAEALREGVAENVRAACEGADRVGLLLSAGEDSRAVLGAIPSRYPVHAFVFADRENREVQVARRVARVHGAGLVVGERDPAHYMLGFPEVAALVGSIQLFMDVHGYGFQRTLGLAELPLVLGGFSSDSLLKGDYTGRGARSFTLHSPPAGVREELVQEVAERRRAHRERMMELRPRSGAEWDRLWPFSMRKHAANVHGNRRLFASHEPFHCNAVVKLAASVPLGWKLHRRLFHRAMRPFFRRSWYVPHGRHRFPYFGRSTNLVLGAGLAVVRGIRSLSTGELRTRQGPWPRWSQVAASEAAARRWREHPLPESPLSALFAAPAGEEVESTMRHWHPLQRLMMLQLVHLSARAARETDGT